ncbi:MAG TPA: hypothetical protein EYQ69_09645 [Gemmatimonadetes bacterium]|nr:hypothetical protein [Gemmatimonadota bacterium]
MSDYNRTVLDTLSSRKCFKSFQFDRDEPGSLIKEFEDTIFSQDKKVVLSQRPEMVPFDLADELHLKFDAVAVNYRRAMKEQGLSHSDMDGEG